MKKIKYYEVENVNIQEDGTVVGYEWEEIEKFQTLEEAVEKAMQIWNSWCYNDKKQSDVLVNEIVDGEYEGAVASAREIEINELEQERESVIKNFIEEVGAKEMTISEFDEAVHRVLITSDYMKSVPLEDLIENGYIYYTIGDDEIKVELELIDFENKVVKLKDVYYI